MRNLQPVLWMKGTFLSPQHLQSQDRFMEGSMRFQMDAINFCPWGYGRVEIDKPQLAEGNFVITRGHGIFPDGMPFDIPVPDGPPPLKPLKEAFDDDQNEIDIFLCVPEQRHQGLNVTMGGVRDTGTRYFAENMNLRDWNSGLNEKPVTLARKNFRLLTSNESIEGYSKIRIARIRRNGNELQLDDTFIPPLLNIEASEWLMAMTRRLLELLWAKSVLLANQRRMKNMSLADFGTADIAKFWLLYAINSHYPVFHHILEVRRGHPEFLYTTMLSLAGALTTFSTLHPRELPKYDHDNLGRCFSELDEHIRTLLEAAIPSSYISLPLKQIKNFIYATPLAEDRYLRNTRMFLAIASNINEGDLIARTGHLVKVCSSNHIEHLVRNALPGVTLTHTQRPPDAIPAKLYYQYFELTQSGGFWEAIERAKNCAAYVPAEIPNPTLELVILLPEAV